MDANTSFERSFVQVVVETLVKKGIKHAPFGRAIFGDESGSRIWLQVRDESKPRRLSLAEAHKIALFLGKDFPALTWEVQQEIEKK